MLDNTSRRRLREHVPRAGASLGLAASAPLYSTGGPPGAFVGIVCGHRGAPPS